MNDPLLILEDDMMLAMMLEDVLNHIGANNIVTASSIEEAHQQIERVDLKYAFLDVNVGSEKSFGVAKKLRTLNIPFSFTSGNEHVESDDELANAHFVRKPYSADDLRAALQDSGLL